MNSTDISNMLRLLNSTHVLRALMAHLGIDEGAHYGSYQGLIPAWRGEVLVAMIDAGLTADQAEQLPVVVSALAEEREWMAYQAKRLAAQCEFDDEWSWKNYRLRLSP